MPEKQAAGPQFYRQVVQLDREQHREWSLRPTQDAGFARNAHAVLALVTEFADLSREYPLVFVRNGERVFPVAMLGLREGENLFVESDGHWAARYVPAYVRRYPFIFSETPEGQLMLSIEESFAGLNKIGGEGVRLFDEDGKESEYLKQALEFSRRFQEGYNLSVGLGQSLDDMGLLKEMNLNAQLPDGMQIHMSGIYIVDEQKLQALTDVEVARLFRNGQLGLIFIHLASIGNVMALLPKLTARDEAQNQVRH